ncbi:5'-nucleotidase [Corynebacterium suedekumii]|nr:5'-nucleotidase [Corynebacterium suedekumii]
MAEAGRASMADFLGEDVDLGFMNAGGVRQDLPAGEVTYRDVFNIQPFGNGIAVGKLTGADILLALEQQWKDAAASRPRLALGFSDGFSYSYDPTAPQGERVIEATLHGEAIDPARTYSVAMSSSSSTAATASTPSPTSPTTATSATRTSPPSPTTSRPTPPSNPAVPRATWA